MAEEGSANNDYAHERGLSTEEIVRRYGQWSQYEKDLNEGVYRGPTIAADAVARFVPEDERKSARILDVAAGSGFVGEKLRDRGFQSIDGLEPSELLQMAINKGVYDRTFQNYLDGNRTPGIEADYYDVVVIAGGMGEGHIPCKGLDELIRVVKPGGMAIIVMREAYLQSVAEYLDRLEPRMQELAAQGRWSQLERSLVPNYSFQNTGVVFVFKVLEESGTD